MRVHRWRSHACAARILAVLSLVATLSDPDAVGCRDRSPDGPLGVAVVAAAVPVYRVVAAARGRVRPPAAASPLEEA